MPTFSDIHIADYDYHLPDDKIAKYPLQQRDQSKLLIYKNQTIQQDIFHNLPREVPDHSLLIFNNTKVIHARLNFQKETGAAIEIFCLEPRFPADYYHVFDSKNMCRWKCLIGNKRKWKSGKLQQIIKTSQKRIILHAEIKETIDESFLIEFSWDGELTFGEILDQTGNIPIPPYLHRKSEQIDFTRYQTVYSNIKGSVAAPTAGLHFTPQILNQLENRKVQRKEITLHVGAGTFQPVKAGNMNDHIMHTEHFSIHKETVRALAEAKRIIAVGTTSLRTIESIYHLARKIVNQQLSLQSPLKLGQWEPYVDHKPEDSKQLMLKLAETMDRNGMHELHASTQIMVVPGYKFSLTDGLITNFHLPKSTLLLLIAALVGDSWKDIYDYALKQKFRFLSYGDSSLLMPCRK